jgi:VanZ family protein
MGEEDRSLRYRPLWLAIGLALVALVIYLSLATEAPDPGRIEGVKSGHFTAYLILMLWFSQIFQGWWQRLAIGVALTLLGIGLEYAQGMTTYRTFAYTDMRDNALGVVLGMAAAATPLGRLLGRLEARLPARGGREGENKK